MVYEFGFPRKAKGYNYGLDKASQSVQKSRANVALDFVKLKEREHLAPDQLKRYRVSKH